MTRSRGGAPTQRQLKVGEEIRHALAEILGRGELRDPDLAEAQVTVTEVRVSPDLKAATVFVTRFGGGDAAGLVKALKRAAPFLRRELAHQAVLRVTPSLRFEADRTFEQATRIDSLLKDPAVTRDLEDEDDGEAA
jgi:ribosome-binding factor A